MGFRRKIAFSAILTACLVLFAHAVVPHHHRAADLALCTETTGQCTHHTAAAFPDGTTVIETSDNCTCGTSCAPTLPFSLKHSSDFGSDLPVIVLICLPELLPEPEVRASAAYTPAEPHLIAQCDLHSLPRRAPPVL